MITPDLTAFVAKMHLEYPRRITGGELEKMVREFMSEVSLDCVKAGVKLIGHIKCVVETPGNGYLACSVTGHDGRVSSKGTLDDSKRMDMILNVILYGLEMDVVKRIVEIEAESRLSGGEGKISIESIELEDHHDRHDHEDHHRDDGHADVHSHGEARGRPRVAE